MSTNQLTAVRPSAPSRRSRLGRALPNGRSWWVSPALWLVSALVGLGVWAFLSWWYGTSVIASPHQVLTAARELWENGTLGSSVVASSRRIAIGWGLGVVIGAPVGLLMGRFNIVRQLLDPYIEFFRYIPPIAFVTLAIVWFGIGESSKIVLIFYTSVFIVTVSAIAAVTGISETKLQAAVNLGAGRWALMRTIVLPAAVPGIVTGARLALGNSFLTIVSAEIVAADEGIGAMIWQARNYARIDWTFVGIITLGLLGFIYDRILRIASRRALGRYGVR